MKEQIRDIIAQSRTTTDASLLVREYLQARVLEALQRVGTFGSWAFLGETALRFLYRLPRFSEDLDFSLVGPATSMETVRPEFVRIIAKVRKTFEAETYAI